MLVIYHSYQITTSYYVGYPNTNIKNIEAYTHNGKALERVVYAEKVTSSCNARSNFLYIYHIAIVLSSKTPALISFYFPRISFRTTSQ